MSTNLGRSTRSSMASWGPGWWSLPSRRSGSLDGTGSLKSTREHRRLMSDLADAGARRIEWARDHMPVLAAIREELKRKQNLRGLRIGMALHVEAKTGVLALTLREAGAKVRLASCNPLSTHDSVAAALAEKHGLHVYAKKRQEEDEEYLNLHKRLGL